MAEVEWLFRLIVTLALGDAPNDLEILEYADFGVVVANSTHNVLAPLPGGADGRISITDAEGPVVGWNAAVNAFLDARHRTAKDTELG